MVIHTACTIYDISPSLMSLLYSIYCVFLHWAWDGEDQGASDSGGVWLSFSSLFHIMGRLLSRSMGSWEVPGNGVYLTVGILPRFISHLFHFGDCLGFIVLLNFKPSLLFVSYISLPFLVSGYETKLSSGERDGELDVCIHGGVF